MLPWPHNNQRCCFLLSLNLSNPFYVVGPSGSSQCGATNVNPFLLFSDIRRVLWQDFQEKEDQIFQRVDKLFDSIFSEIILNNHN